MKRTAAAALALALLAALLQPFAAPADAQTGPAPRPPATRSSIYAFELTGAGRELVALDNANE